MESSTPYTIRPRTKIDEPRRVRTLAIDDTPATPAPAGRLLEARYHFRDPFVVLDAVRAAGYRFQSAHFDGIRFTHPNERRAYVDHVAVNLNDGRVIATGPDAIALLAQLAEVRR